MLVIIGFVVVFGFFAIFAVISGNRKNEELLETVTKSDRGTRSERDLILTLLKNGISAQAIFHDLYVKKNNGDFSQIDLVVATKVGIIVFEVKDYSGWIFGNGRQSQWTKVLAYGKEKYRFYNPIMQNNTHIAALRKQLIQFEKVPFYSIIAFYGDCELKDVSFVPRGTFIAKSTRVLDVVNAIISDNETANYTDKNEIIKTLRECVKNGVNRETQTKHIENIKDMLGKERIFE
jgi:hypothetical protein